MRIFIDKLGDGHKDIFLKIDAIPNSFHVADSYFLSEFLELNNDDFDKMQESEKLKYSVIKLLEYWEKLLENIENKQRFLPFDFSDEYISGILIQNHKFGYKILFATTDKIFGWNTNKTIFEEQIEKYNCLIFDSHEELILSKDRLKNGLKWSKNELQ